VVYDLGCGDGRIVVTAVSKYDAKRGVGIDLDPKRIRDSEATAKAAGVEGKVEFRRGDVLEIKDFSPASVVTLYLANPVNERLRPTLQKTLKPGSRIVSHRFLMGDWKPDKTVKVVHEGEEFLLHLWTIPQK
jgi:cyclopropane fatty-acyl-phospholipid synthase-like methyltransferase